MKKVGIVFIFVYFQTLRSYSYEFKISFEPLLIRGLNRWDSKNVYFNISLLNEFNDSVFESEFELNLQTAQNSEYPRKVIEIIGQKTYYFNISTNKSYFTSDFKIKGLFLGYSNITFEIRNNKSLVQSLPNYSVSVIRKTTIFDTLFGILIISLVSINYVNMGCHFDFQIVKKALKTPTGPLIGFVCQFTVMPIVSFFVHKTLFSIVFLKLLNYF